MADVLELLEALIAEWRDQAAAIVTAAHEGRPRPTPRRTEASVLRRCAGQLELLVSVQHRLAADSAAPEVSAVARAVSGPNPVDS